MSAGNANSAKITSHVQNILDDLEKADQDARRIAGGLSDAQANWQPNETEWSIAQCLDHLGRSNTLYASALHKAVKETRREQMPQLGPIQPGWFGRYFIRTMEPPPKRKMRAPEKIVPASRIAAQQALEGFLRSQDDVRAVIRDAAGLDLNHIRFRNPFIGFLRFTVGTGLMVLAAHTRRHLWQAERVLESAGFPKS